MLPATTTARAGNRLPGIPRHALFAAFGWMPPQGWRAGAEVRAVSRVYANDGNSARAPGYAVAALHAGTAANTLTPQTEAQRRHA